MTHRGEQERSDGGVAVIGAGYWGRNLVRNFHDLHALGAICDSDQKMAMSFKQQYPAAKIFSAYSDALRDSTIQAVAVATPAEAHAAPWSREMSLTTPWWSEIRQESRDGCALAGSRFR
jgi:UDP-N-acetylmuramoylalanine-D-glutamate ligase